MTRQLYGLSAKESVLGVSYALNTRIVDRFFWIKFLSIWKDALMTWVKYIMHS